MSYSLAIRMTAEPLRSLAFGSISANYMGIGPGFANPIRVMVIQNLTDQTLLFSFDGITDNFILPSEGQFVLDITTNQSLEQGCFFPQGQRVYVKDTGTEPTTGSAYIAVFYASNGY